MFICSKCNENVPCFFIGEYRDEPKKCPMEEDNEPKWERIKDSSIYEILSRAAESNRQNLKVT